jgi:predicted nucleotidyltransferase
VVVLSTWPARGVPVTVQSELAAAIVRALSPMEGVVGIWIDGSLSRDSGDAHSDVDIGVAVADDRLSSLLETIPAVLKDQCHAVLVKVAGRLVNLVTPEWTRADIFVRTASEIAGGVPGPVEVTYDPDGSVRQVDSGVATVPVARLGEAVEEFIRLIGLLPVAVARGEWIGAYVATGGMAAMVTEVMQYENGTHRIGGALRLSDRLTPEQKAVFDALPPLHPDRIAVVETQLALARSFFVHARRVAAALEVPYPEAAEAAVRAHLDAAGLAL